MSPVAHAFTCVNASLQLGSVLSLFDRAIIWRSSAMVNGWPEGDIFIRRINWNLSITFYILTCCTRFHREQGRVVDIWPLWLHKLPNEPGKVLPFWHLLRPIHFYSPISQFSESAELGHGGVTQSSGNITENQTKKVSTSTRPNHFGWFDFVHLFLAPPCEEDLTAACFSKFGNAFIDGIGIWYSYYSHR